jgi:hypothetical protein
LYLIQPPATSLSYRSIQVISEVSAESADVCWLHAIYEAGCVQPRSNLVLATHSPSRLFEVDGVHRRRGEERMVFEGGRGFSVGLAVPETSTGVADCLAADLSNGHHADDLVSPKSELLDASSDDLAQLLRQPRAFECVVGFTVEERLRQQRIRIVSCANV